MMMETIFLISDDVDIKHVGEFMVENNAKNTIQIKLHRNWVHLMEIYEKHFVQQIPWKLIISSEYSDYRIISNETW